MTALIVRVGILFHALGREGVSILDNTDDVTDTLINAESHGPGAFFAIPRTAP